MQLMLHVQMEQNITTQEGMDNYYNHCFGYVNRSTYDIYTILSIYSAELTVHRYDVDPLETDLDQEIPVTIEKEMATGNSDTQTQTG